MVTSSTAAEALSANDTLDDMMYIKNVLKEILGSDVDHASLNLFTDSKNLYDSVNTSTLVENPRLLKLPS